MPRLLVHLISLTVFSILALAGCSSDIDDAKELIDLENNPPQRMPIDTSRMGVNAFFNTSGFGSTSAQFLDIRDTLRLKHTRILFAWTNGVQPTPGSAIDFGFFDSIIDAIPAGVDVLITVAHTPDWMANPANWIDGDPIKTWVERFLVPLLTRYGNDPRVAAWQIFNEPDSVTVGSDSALGLTDASRYLQMLQMGSARVRELDPSSLVVLAASRSIQQSGDGNLDYNKVLFELGAQDFVDIWAVHYYGKQFEKVVLSDGVASFLNQLNRPIWLTESGEMGFDNVAIPA